MGHTVRLLAEALTTALNKTHFQSQPGLLKVTRPKREDVPGSETNGPTPVSFKKIKTGLIYLFTVNLNAYLLTVLSISLTAASNCGSWPFNTLL